MLTVRGSSVNWSPHHLCSTAPQSARAGTLSDTETIQDPEEIMRRDTINCSSSDPLLLLQCLYKCWIFFNQIDIGLRKNMISMMSELQLCLLCLACWIKFPNISKVKVTSFLFCEKSILHIFYTGPKVKKTVICFSLIALDSYKFHTKTRWSFERALEVL